MYNPNKKEKEIIKRTYDDIDDMLTLKKKRHKYFNDRTLEEFIDDNEFRFTGYSPTREEQGKEDWQANVFHPVTRNKTEALLASVALDVPEIRITAQNDKQLRDQMAAYVMRHIVKGSYDNSNKEEQIYFEALEACVKGTVISYNGYVNQKAKRKIVKSVDVATGTVEYEEEEITVKDECVDFIVPLENFLIKDVNIRDIQEQPAIAWIDRLSEDEFHEEFNKYPNYKFVKTSSELTQKSETARYFKQNWSERTTKEDPIEVIRYWNKYKDEFIILANGVLLLESPMLLGKKVKMYPFSKTVFKPFAQDFFYGNSLPNSLMGEQDVINALYNMAIDKTYRSAIPPLLIGDDNKDDFDLADEIIENDTKIYVRDINKVREMPISGVDGAMFNMMELMSRGLDLSSVDSAQQGVSGGATAREVVIANENAKKLKGVFYMFLTDLWRQKTILRIYNILVYYTQPKIEKILGKGGVEKKIESWRKFIIENAELTNGNGTLGIQMVGSGRELPPEENPEELDKNEIEYEKSSGENYEEMAITSNYLDNWQYDVKVMSDSLYQKESSLTQAKVEAKIQMMMQAFPQFFQMNQEKLFKDALIAFDDDPDEYQLQPPAPQLPEGMEGIAGEEQTPGEEMATAGQAGLPPVPEV